MLLKYYTICFCFSGVISSNLNVDQVAVKGCVFPTPFSTFNLTWAENVPVFYETLASKSDLFETVLTAFGHDALRLMTKEQVYTPCFSYKFHNGTYFNLMAFGKDIGNFKLHFSKLQPGKYEWGALGGNGTETYAGTSYIVLSDNKSFFVSMDMWENGLKSFFVASTSEEALPRETVEEIMKVVGPQGFPMKLNTDLSYKACAGQLKKQWELNENQ